MSKDRDPESDAEWQEAADAAWFCLLVDSAVQYGLVVVEGEPVDGKSESGVNVERCEWILAEAAKRGIAPKKEFQFQ